jgi:hypothetical protein
MLFVSNLDSSITFYTTAFDLQVAQRITELTVTGANGAPAARPVKMALLKFPGQEFVLELAERPATSGGRLRTTSTSASTSATLRRRPSACGKLAGSLPLPSKLSVRRVELWRRTCFSADPVESWSS